MNIIESHQLRTFGKQFDFRDSHFLYSPKQCLLHDGHHFIVLGAFLNSLIARPLCFFASLQSSALDLVPG